MTLAGHATPGDVRLSDDHERLWRYLWTCARGRAVAVPRRRIAAALSDAHTDVGCRFLHMTDRAFRKLADELCAAGYPAWANDRGYYAGRDDADLLAYRSYLAAKAKALHRRGHAARWALEAQRARVAGDPVAAQVEVAPDPAPPRRRILVPVGPVHQPSVGQGSLL